MVKTLQYSWNLAGMGRGWFWKNIWGQIAKLILKTKKFEL